MIPIDRKAVPGIIEDDGLYILLSGHYLKSTNLHLLPEWMQEIRGEVEYYPDTNWVLMKDLYIIPMQWTCKPPKMRRIR